MRTMTDMGMDHGMQMPGMNMGGAAAPPAPAPPAKPSDLSPAEMERHKAMGHAMPAAPAAPPAPPKMDGMEMKGMTHDQMPGMQMPMNSGIPTTNADGVDPKSLKGKPNVDNVAMETKDRLGEAGDGLDGNGRRVLTYRDLRSLAPHAGAPPTRAIEFHLTGNMERWVWGFNGKKFSRRAHPLRADQRHDDGASRPPARLLVRGRERQGRSLAVEAYHQRQAGRAPELRLHRRRARALGVPLPSALSHGDGHVPHCAGVMSGRGIALVAAAALGVASRAEAQMSHASDAAPTTAAPFGSPVDDQHIFYHALVNELEGRFGSSNTFRWSGEAWAGTDENRIWFRSEGKLTGGAVDDSQQELFYSRPISTYFNGMVGARYDLDSLPGRGWGAIGVEGLAPLFFRVAATGYVSGDGHLAAKLEGSYDLLITQRLILQPQIEMNFYTKDDPARLIGSGLSDIDAGLRLRYEITRKFAPYVGVTHDGKFGGTAAYARAGGGLTDEVRFTAGVQAWF